MLALHTLSPVQLRSVLSVGGALWYSIAASHTVSLWHDQSPTGAPVLFLASPAGRYSSSAHGAGVGEGVGAVVGAEVGAAVGAEVGTAVGLTQLASTLARQFQHMDSGCEPRKALQQVASA